MAETSRQRFIRIAPKRVERLLREIKLIGNLANRNHYDYTEDEVEKIFNAVESEVRISRGKFSFRRTERFEL
jgi:hypothetical protein